MDLGACPRCSAQWVQGDERCRQCGYTAIGAGLSRLPKKKKKKIRAYREPGSATPMLSVTLLAMLAGGGYFYKPWMDDWDYFRAMFGSGRHHNLKGDWEITETLIVKGGDTNALTKAQVASGLFSFDGKDGIKIVVTDSSGSSTATGHYTIDGTNLNVFGLATTGESSANMPKELKLTVAWTGPDAFVAAISKDDTIMLRRKEGNDLKQLAHMAMSKNVEDAPESVRGLISTIQNNNSGGGDN